MVRSMEGRRAQPPVERPSEAVGRDRTRRERGRGERILPGLWRLRLPLPWPGVPHCNAWAIQAASGIVLVDTGMHEPGSLAQLERALDQVDLRSRTWASSSARTLIPTIGAGGADLSPRQLRIVDAPQPRSRHRVRFRSAEQRSHAGSRSDASPASRETALRSYAEQMKEIPSGIAE